jgi:hypothetical protein
VAAIVKTAPAVSPGGVRAPAWISLALAILSFGIFAGAMAYPWQLAVLAGAAIGALGYSTWGTWRRMRLLYSRPAADGLTIGGGGAPEPIDGESGLAAGRRLAPGEERQGGGEQQMNAAAEDESGHEQHHPAREEHTGQE